jgi:hypothetical protein
MGTRVLPRPSFLQNVLVLGSPARPGQYQISKKKDPRLERKQHIHPTSLSVSGVKV